MTTLNAAAALLKKSKVARAIVATSLAFALAGCETGSSILGTADSSPPAAAMATPTPPPTSQTRIAIAPVIGAPDGVSRELQGQLGASAEKLRVAVTKSPTDKADYTLRGYIVSAREKSGTKVSYIWDVTDPAGKRVHRITGEEIARGSKNGKDPWSAVTPDVVQKISNDTASSLSSWLSAQSAPAVASNTAPGRSAGSTQALASTSVGTGSLAASPTTGSIERNGSLATHIPSVTGAPGDGSVALTNALRGELSRNGVQLADNSGNSYRVQGKVSVGAGQDGKQPIQIDWTVIDPKGKQLGTVSQKNEIPQGSLDGAWGKTADAAAAAAAQGILKLLPQQTRTN